MVPGVTKPNDMRWLPEGSTQPVGVGGNAEHNP